jgi:hypothetical protein
LLLAGNGRKCHHELPAQSNAHHRGVRLINHSTTTTKAISNVAKNTVKKVICR